MPIHFDNKILDFINLNSILQENHIINCLPESLLKNEFPSTVYSLSSTIRNQISNYKNTIKTLTLTIPGRMAPV